MLEPVEDARVERTRNIPTYGFWRRAVAMAVGNVAGWLPWRSNASVTNEAVGHLGVRKTLKQVRRRAFWKSWRANIVLRRMLSLPPTNGAWSG